MGAKKQGEEERRLKEDQTEEDSTNTDKPHSQQEQRNNDISTTIELKRRNIQQLIRPHEHQQQHQCEGRELSDD